MFECFQSISSQAIPGTLLNRSNRYKKLFYWRQNLFPASTGPWFCLGKHHQTTPYHLLSCIGLVKSS